MHANSKKTNIGTGVAALLGFACPACIPAVVGALGSIGLGFLVSLKVIIPILILALAGAWYGLWIGYKRHKNITPLIISVIAGIMIPVSRYEIGNVTITYIASGILMLSAVWNYFLLKKATKEACETPHPQQSR